MLARALVVALVAATAVPVAAVQWGDPPEPVVVMVAGRSRAIPQGTTFGGVIRAFRLEASPGRLLDVEGGVIDWRADPGRILANGLPASRRIVLSTGDRIVVDDGENRTEETRQVVFPLHGRRPGNPQFFLGTSRVERIVTQGTISGKIAATAYRAVGPIRRPPRVALTFDDGPWPVTTRDILAILRRFRVKATFFVVGDLVRRYPWLMRRVLRAGMTVGNHSLSHPSDRPFKGLGRKRLREELSGTNRILRRMGVPDPHLMRPPGGSWNAKMVEAARRMGLRLVNWDVDPRDWSDGATKASIVRIVLANVRPGSIVLLHDGGGDQSATVRALPSIIRGIRRMGLRLVALPG